MDEITAQSLISKNFPDLTISKIVKIGEGTGNIAYEVNDHLVFRYPKGPANQIQLAQEIILQPVLSRYSTLPYPKFDYLPTDHSFVGYEKLQGNPLIYEMAHFDAWKTFSEQIGDFLNKLHSIPKNELDNLNILIEDKSFADWQTHSYRFYEKTKHLVPSKHYPEIETFFNSKPQDELVNKVLCHNDLGIEHILVTDGKVSGIIDWGGVAIADPACDFARIYRDIGPRILDMVLAKHNATPEIREQIRVRTVFYAKCLIFEDLYCGIREDEYLQKSLKALEWMFDSSPHM
ncbi:MAG: Aminoglycoside phosphotransferase [Microgenomates group bacterium GW2011_GWC1_46_16]|uniref:Aminoglycoside phosphotransferase domain-containing protein n=2 Tax=Candidatus Collieribacteriota TaxID=1752725 RepID=A0A1F5FZ15_9BACT|nr:MAG: Aminoglycoside phosphotransferase [Microgenomates group bacterium GW2011_GWF1_46_12]KKU26182.1 MAG: Aminoglycoside phosphotransferase [Microgenomates group bacterium GW2011_GWC1_46_16]KKU28168.1 MAG: Aminoglycoside phosphotransferase [Microgenomates group bacterium GW2011_GWF2_46_18]KKU43747.1 MAG: Aminoglycoside phosphotransferase [Microgenomates group bacterium GW2011_GWA1_46_7]KKU45615.1 MAG: Aminoglycoside phosphotransferase [Microgenomates group bacterium GW2011_GWB1_46_7]KKU61542